jgi:prevent-host-death family protein
MKEKPSMSISLTEDVKTIQEFKAGPLKILDQVRETGRPVVITADVKPDVVILDAGTFERRLKAVNLARLLSEAEADVREGRVRSAKTFLDEFCRDKKISG